MNYRHAYHAGGIADVFKHVVLISLLRRLKQKESAFFVLDTHAGLGLYDLTAPQAEKTGEYHGGIGKLFAAAPATALLAAYVQQVRALNPGGALGLYPGSPALVAALLRPHDRAAFCELHPDDAPVLRRVLRAHGNATVHHRDGYEAIGAFLPPREKRGLVLIDPPFETPTELDAAAAALRLANTCFPQGMAALWYPVKERPALWRFHEDMIATGMRKQLAIEFLTGDEGDSRMLNGSGMLLVNPPYRLEDELQPVLQELRELLGLTKGRVTIEWLAGE